MCGEQLELRDGARHFITAMHYTLKVVVSGKISFHNGASCSHHPSLHSC